MSVSDQSSQLDCEPDATTTAEEPEEQALLVFLQPDAISKSAEAGSDLGTLEDNLANAIEQRGAGSSTEMRLVKVGQPYLCTVPMPKSFFQPSLEP
jgi:hypothetical protein